MEQEVGMSSIFDDMIFFVRLHHWKYGTLESIFSHKDLLLKDMFVNKYLMLGWSVEYEKLMNRRELP